MASKFIDDYKYSHRFSDITAEPHQWLQPITGYQEMAVASIEEAVTPLLQILPDINHEIWIAKQNCTTPADGLSPDESLAIYLYSMDWEPLEQSLYFTFNATLRNQDRRKLKPWFLYLKLILTALARLPSTRRIVYRGVNLDLVNDYPEGKTFVWWGFSSCTSSLEVLQSEQYLGKTGVRTLFAIDCYSGKDIRQHSYFPREEHVLLPPGTEFEVKSSLDVGNGLHIIHLKEIEPPYLLLEPVPKVSSLIVFFGS